MSAEQPHKTVVVRSSQRPRSLLVDASAMMVTLGAAAACWLIALSRMKGMDMGVATALGSFSFFVVVWVSMMAAMMLPGPEPSQRFDSGGAAVRRGYRSRRACSARRRSRGRRSRVRSSNVPPLSVFSGVDTECSRG
jgi:hypothetical protein